MPAVVFTDQQKLDKQIADLTKKTKIELFNAGISKKAVADYAGISIQAVSQQFKRGQITLAVYLASQNLLNK